jgi:hypothetical protein
MVAQSLFLSVVQRPQQGKVAADTRGPSPVAPPVAEPSQPSTTVQPAVPDTSSAHQTLGHQEAIKHAAAGLSSEQKGSLSNHSTAPPQCAPDPKQFGDERPPNDSELMPPPAPRRPAAQKRRPRQEAAAVGSAVAEGEGLNAGQAAAAAGAAGASVSEPHASACMVPTRKVDSWLPRNASHRMLLS